ncbi:MAG: hypothetical protein GX620_13370 [Chloroflexi bacterium]|nr:hypothetical protein [Chloroflexota bacterium]
MNTLPPEQRGAVSGREWRFVGLVIAVVLVFTSLPYLYGYLSSPTDKQYMGLMLNVPDHGQYLSWWRSFQSTFLVRNKLTPEANEPLFFNLLWWTLAQVSKWTGLGYAAVYQAFRWVAGGSFLWAAYRLIAQFVPEAPRRRVTFLLLSFSSGLGWVLVVLKYTLTGGELLFPLDVFIAEGNSFLCILGYPHFAFAITFIALAFEFAWRGWREERTWPMVWSGVVSFLLGWMHAYDLLLIYVIIGAFALSIWVRDRVFPWRLFWGGVIIAVLSCSGAVYSVILTTVDPLWEEVLAQFANAGVYTPTPPHLVILFGFPLILAAIAWIGMAVRRHWSDERLFVMGWFAAGAVLIYIPTDYQIHMLNSWQIPMVILATGGLYDVIIPAISKIGVGIRGLGLNRQRVSQLVIVTFLLAVIPTNLYLWVWRFVDLARHDHPYFLYRDEVAALDWLRENTSADDVVLSSITIGQYVPALSANTAFLAHWAQTVDFYDKSERVESFFDTTVSDDARVETLRTFGVAYVFHGPAERALGGYDPGQSSLFREVYSSPAVRLYAVRE